VTTVINIALLVSTIALISSCSNTKQTISRSYNTEDPTTYEEYKQWRQDNDPAAEKYAEYKEWQTAYKYWKAQEERKFR